MGVLSDSSAPWFGFLESAPRALEATNPKPSLKYSPQTPTPKQAEFLATQEQEVLYGGAAGGAKSSALLMGALQYVHVPGYAALLLRRSYADLTKPEALLDRARTWLGGTDAKPHEGGQYWTFPSGARLDFGYLQNRGDEFQYQGAAYQYIGFDELTQFEEYQYRYLISRCRRSQGSMVPLRMRAGANPGGVGHDWVKRRFLTEGPSAGRRFISAKLSDNPHIDQIAYIKALNELDPVTRAQLLNGNWDVVPDGTMFKREWFRCTREGIPRDMKRLRLARYWDFAATAPKPGKDPDWTVGALVALDDAGQWWILDIIRFQGTPKAVEESVRKAAEFDGREVPVVIEQEPGSSGLHVIDHYRRYVLVGWNVVADKKTGDKRTLAGPLSSAAQAGNVTLFEAPWNGALLDEFASFPLDGMHDDQVDACSGGMRHLASGDGRYLAWDGDRIASRFSLRDPQDDWDVDPPDDLRRFASRKRRF